jgi:hypothetical protein
MRKIYLIGSLRNERVPLVSAELRRSGHAVFDDWFAAGPEADDCWQRYETQRGRTYSEALAAPHAQDVFDFDKRHLDAQDTAVLLMPAGKSGHLELGYMIGCGKQGFILIEGPMPERYDVMYNFASGGVFFSVEELVARLAQGPHYPRTGNGNGNPDSAGRKPPVGYSYGFGNKARTLYALDAQGRMPAEAYVR